MKNIALEFKKYIEVKEGSFSPQCQELIRLYKTPIVSLKNLEYDKTKCVSYYKNKIEKFLKLVKYLSSVNITENDYTLTKNFLEDCSILEAEVFYMILTVYIKEKYQFFRYVRDLGMVTIQRVPNRAKRCIITIVNGDIKVEQGDVPKELFTPLRKYFKTFEGTLDCFIKSKVLYLHDVWTKKPTKYRLVYLSKLSQTKYVKILIPTFHIDEQDWMGVYKQKDVLVKPIEGQFTDAYIKRTYHDV